jgi:hypothetical protein
VKKKWIAAVAFLLIAAGTGWYFVSPGWTLKQMADAAQSRDADKLSAYVDYPKLRDTTKSQLKAAMASKIASGSNNGFEALGMMVGLAMMDTMIDGVLTPEGMEAMFAKAKESETVRPPAKKPFGLDANNREIVRDGLDRFRLHEKGRADQDGDLIFERHGFGWKLAEIKVPQHLFDDKK